MQDPVAWSFPMGRLFGVTIRVHWLYPFVALSFILWAAYGKPIQGETQTPGLWHDAVVMMLLLFLSVLFHEYAHCFAARGVGGEANEILMWPLGGLAYVDLPHRPGAHFLTAAAGPASNLLLCALCAVLLLFVADRAYVPPLNPFYSGWPARWEGESALVQMVGYDGTKRDLHALSSPAVWIARLFWVNWFLALLNIVLVGFPLDGGRMLQSALWPHVGYRQATLAAVYAGFFGVAIIVAMFAVIFSSVLSFALALFVADACRRQWMQLETGGEEGVFGYDFSQGYTSLERGAVDAQLLRPRVGWWRRWTARRAAKRLLREQEQREAEERRLDDLLDKVHRQGRSSLTAEEERFMKRVADRYREKP
ncbi:MAG: site-2 protease family protein [Gemmataceae bacterium]|nr:site-2 protease family protein [Gemmataceae bacterium]